jgi:hypothetical protein
MTDLVISLGGLLYGLLLVAATFSRRQALEALRIDALVLPNPGEATRALNLVCGAALIAYQLHVLFR